MHLVEHLTIKLLALWISTWAGRSRSKAFFKELWSALHLDGEASKWDWTEAVDEPLQSLHNFHLFITWDQNTLMKLLNLTVITIMVVWPFRGMVTTNDGNDKLITKNSVSTKLARSCEILRHWVRVDDVHSWLLLAPAVWGCCRSPSPLSFFKLYELYVNTFALAISYYLWFQCCIIHLERRSGWSITLPSIAALHWGWHSLKLSRKVQMQIQWGQDNLLVAQGTFELLRPCLERNLHILLRTRRKSFVHHEEQRCIHLSCLNAHLHLYIPRNKQT